MKLILILLLAFFSNNFLYSQDEELYPENEFTIQIQNAQYRTIVFELIPIGSNWAKTYSGCNISAYNDPTIYTSSLYSGDLGDVDCYWNGFQYRFSFQGSYTVLNNCA